jgi:hypothetical protein
MEDPPEEAVVLDTLLPEVLAVVPLLEVELDDVLVVSLGTAVRSEQTVSQVARGTSGEVCCD